MSAGIRDVPVGDRDCIRDVPVGDDKRLPALPVAVRLPASRICKNLPDTAAALAMPSLTDAGAVDTSFTRRVSNRDSNACMVSPKLPSRRSGEVPRLDLGRPATIRKRVGAW